MQYQFNTIDLTSNVVIERDTRIYKIEIIIINITRRILLDIFFIFTESYY